MNGTFYINCTEGAKKEVLTQRTMACGKPAHESLISQAKDHDRAETGMRMLCVVLAEDATRRASRYS